MSNVSGIMEAEDVVGEQTLANRVSNTLKGGSSSWSTDNPVVVMQPSVSIVIPSNSLFRHSNESYSRPPMLFRHASMQKLRHCCQNLNLFPYLLYSFGNSKSHPIALKVHLCFGQLLEVVTARLLCLYQQLRHSLLRGIKSSEDIQVPEAQSESRSRSESCRPTMKFLCLPQEKPKEIPLSLTLAVYLAPLFLLFQLVGLLGLMEAGKCTPGFIFLISALLFLGCISLKVFFHETMPRPARRQKKKVL